MESCFSSLGAKNRVASDGSYPALLAVMAKRC